MKARIKYTLTALQLAWELHSWGWVKLAWKIWGTLGQMGDGVKEELRP